ncbi:glycerophosphodiester phosphodiesterase family protein [Bacillus sp. FJAT-49736]|uniref:glycerophosphodiester phosphodiesterase family protein n=1 Tax=Bacillus sp. FJAT-49736 TaxID=2833582 RepID=UPI001BCA48D6|nr:glycerophosphodiester phosphodiesterase family protein [Bacillus sp. FJAT-49736]MBS4174229.1 glycerophosphodiester phosphodiesterase [Bacillus sp. FJAT-49736]
MKTLQIILIIGIFILTVIGYSEIANAAKSVKIIAHRGASDRAPEETMSAFKLAVKNKADYIEMDLRLTKDNQLILMHDQTVDRTTNGHGNVGSFSFQQLKQLDAGTWFHEKYKNERLISLEELLHQFGSRTQYFIETREVDNELKMEKPLLDLLNQKGLITKNKVIIESFSDKSLKKIHEMNDKIPLVQLVKLQSKHDFTMEKITEWKKYALGIGMNSDLADKELIRTLHRNNLKVYIFFFDVNSEKAEQKRVMEAGADGIFTNHILYTQSLLRKR